MRAAAYQLITVYQQIEAVEAAMDGKETTNETKKGE